MAKLFVEQRFLDEIISIIQKLYPKAIVWAYGSRINGSAHEGSDLDLVVKDFGQNDANIFSLREDFIESNIPFLIDVFELKSLPESFQKEIEKNYVVIYDGQKSL